MYKTYTIYTEILYLCSTLSYRGLVMPVCEHTLLTHQLKPRNHDYLSMSR